MFGSPRLVMVRGENWRDLVWNEWDLIINVLCSAANKQIAEKSKRISKSTEVLKLSENILC